MRLIWWLFIQFTYCLTPRSSIYTSKNINKCKPEEKTPNYHLSVLPGQYWLQNDFSEKPISVARGFLSNGPNSIDSLLCNLPKGVLWDLATTSFYQLSGSFKCSNQQQNPVPRKRSLTIIDENTVETLQKYLIESPAFGPLPVDFFEHVSETHEVCVLVFCNSWSLFDWFCRDWM